jgi:hypothetical protein
MNGRKRAKATPRQQAGSDTNDDRVNEQHR